MSSSWPQSEQAPILAFLRQLVHHPEVFGTGEHPLLVVWAWALTASFPFFPVLFRFRVPVCPHAGGVGLCEYVIHLR